MTLGKQTLALTFAGLFAGLAFFSAILLTPLAGCFSMFFGLVSLIVCVRGMRDCTGIAARSALRVIALLDLLLMLMPALYYMRHD